MLHREVADLTLLMEALRSLLADDGDAEPFVSVFNVLEPLFNFSHAVVLGEDARDPRTLRCLVATMAGLTDTAWPRSELADRVLRRGRVLATVAPEDEAQWPDMALAAGLAPEQPALYLPVGFRDQRGLLMLLRPLGAAGFDRHDVAMARRLSLLASQAFATRQANRADRERHMLRDLTADLRTARDSLEYRANHDELTGLASRAHFESITGRAISAGLPDRRFALAFIDLDGFKQVNDYYGHDVGDQLLMAVADRLRHQTRTGDVLARISGDEFMMLIDPIEDEDALGAVIARALDCMRRPFVLGQRHLMVSASIGAAIYPEHGDSYEQLRRNADMAMYSAKSTARGTAEVYRDSLGRAAAERLAREQDLRRAIAQRRFRAVLQPEVHLRSRRIVGFEVLARQVDDDGRIGDSAEFVALAAHLGLLDEITDIVVADALGSLPALDAAFGADTTISVNVSAKQFTDPASLSRLLHRLRRSGYRRRFVVEVTEDALLESSAAHSGITALLRESQVRVSIDDFGTGYASLSRLLTVTADEIKIDRSFIAGVHESARSQVLVRAIDYLGDELGPKVVAEGIETADELRYLMEHSAVDMAQGYLFAPPAPAAELCAGRDELLAHLAAVFGP